MFSVDLRLRRASPQFSWLVPLVLTFSLAAQGRVWIVDEANGPGADFTDLPPAITAASPGDVIRARPGSYSGITIRKGLSIFGEPGASISRIVWFTDGIRVESVPAGQEVSVVGFPIPSSGHLGGRPVTVSGCLGSVLLDGISGATGNGFGNQDRPAMVIENSRLVIVTSSTFHGTPAIAVTSSTLVLTDSTLTAPPDGTHLNTTGPAMIAIDAKVILSRGTARGGDVPFGTRAAGPAVASTRTSWIVNGGAVLVAGTHPTAQVMAMSGDGTVALHPSVRLTPSGGAPPIDPNLIVTTALIPSLEAKGERPGRVVQLHLLAEPNDLAALVVGHLGPVIDLNLGSPLFLDLTRPTIVLPPALVDASGSLRLSFIAPTDPSTLGFRGSWQAVAGSLARGLWLSNPDAYVH